MSTFSSAGQTLIPLPANVANAREGIMAKLGARIEGGNVKPPEEAPPPSPPAKEPVVELAPEAPEPEPVVVEEPVAEAAEAEAPPPAKAAPKAPPKTKLSKSMEIQRRAEAAVRRARSEAGKLRTQATESAKQATQTDAAADEIARAKAEVGRLQQEYNRAVRHLKDDPLGFAKVHGVDPASLAQYVASGADPTQRTMENIRQESQRALAQMKAEYDQKLAAIQNSFVESQETVAQQNFFQFIEESKAANPEAFAALASDLVYSPADIWNVANHLLETRPDLRDNFDEDKLLEAVESEARKDPRWSKVKALQSQVRASQQSNAAAKSKKPNVSEVTEERPAPAAAPRPQPKRDPANGQFQSGTPFTRHSAHVEQIARRARLIG